MSILRRLLVLLLEDWALALLGPVVTAVWASASGLSGPTIYVLVLLALCAAVFLRSHRETITDTLLAPPMTFEAFVRRGQIYLEVKNNRETDTFRAQVIGWSHEGPEIKPTRPIELPWGKGNQYSKEIQHGLTGRIRLGHCKVEAIEGETIAERIGPSPKKISLYSEPMKDFLEGGPVAGRVFSKDHPVKKYSLHLVVIVSAAEANIARQVGVTVTLVGRPEDDPTGETAEHSIPVPRIVAQVHEGHRFVRIE